MLNQITWAGYFTALFILLFVYYVCVLFCYFRHEVTLLISGKIKLFGNNGNLDSQLNSKVNVSNPVSHYSASRNLENRNSSVDKKIHPELSSLVHDLTYVLKSAIQKAGEQGFKKEELLFSLQILIKDYAELKETNFIDAINNLITSECQNFCSILLSEEDTKMLWL